MLLLHPPFTISLLYFLDQLIDRVDWVYKFGEDSAYLRFLVAITSSNGRKISDSCRMDGLLIHILQVNTIMCLNGINSVSFKHIFAKRIPSPEGMRRHTDSSVSMDLFQHLEEVQIIVIVPRVPGMFF